MGALKTGATGRYVDDDKNTFGVLVIGPHFTVKSPGKDEETGEDLPPARVPVEGVVRARLFDEHGDSWLDNVKTSRIEVCSDGVDPTVASRLSSLESSISNLSSRVAAVEAAAQKAQG